MTNSELNNLMLRRYWFKTTERLGFGVTAYSIDDAKHLIDDAARRLGWDYKVLGYTPRKFGGPILGNTWP